VDATQWDDHGPHGEHYDRTLMTPSFLAAYAPPVPKTPIIKRIVQRIVPVRHRTGEATEKPWGAIPLPRGEWYGLDDGTPRSHSGKDPADHRAIKQIQREVGAKDDGDYGPVTAWHVVAYQRRRKVYPADGATGVETWDDMATHD
jgi:peptidoglycan hydrolase-like protein with peptidoglycan-binding domain